MSLVKYNDIKSYWALGCFVGHDTFCDCMSRTRFQNIQSAVQFSAQSTYDANMAHNNPLWFICLVLDQFIKKSASIAVPVGVSALDEIAAQRRLIQRPKPTPLISQLNMQLDFMLLWVTNVAT
jgi:hypothetical protein